MLDIVLKILCVLGIVLLILLGILLVTLLLVLFFPISYRLQGKKNSQELTAFAGVSWLFGLLRLRYSYPEPGNVVVKLLCFTVFDSRKAAEKRKAEESNASDKKEQAVKKEEAVKAEEAGKVDEAGKAGENEKTAAKSNTQTNAASNTEETNGQADTNTQGNTSTQDNPSDAPEDEAKKQPEPKPGIRDRIIAQYEKIRYTILKIYDKIKHIVYNITFYKELLQEEQTKELFRHALFRLGRIWKNIHPRKLKGEILFGAASPDSTGYALAVYGMLSPWIGNHINITPDFSQAILEGELYVAGHITIFQVVFHGLKLALDKRLQLLIKKIKSHNKENV